MRSQITAIGVISSILLLSGCAEKVCNLGQYTVNFSEIGNFKESVSVVSD